MKRVLRQTQGKLLKAFLSKCASTSLMPCGRDGIQVGAELRLSFFFSLLVCRCGESFSTSLPCSAMQVGATHSPSQLPSFPSGRLTVILASSLRICTDVFNMCGLIDMNGWETGTLVHKHKCTEMCVEWCYRSFCFFHITWSPTYLIL